MHPAPSVIIFTSLSGLGFGLLFWLGLGLPAVSGWVAFTFFFIAYALAVGGLMASTFHLGHPERAIKAFTQWRSSWLSREAWSAVAALIISGLYALLWIFFDLRLSLLGLLAAMLSLVTVFTTSMIYAQIKAIPRWHMPWTPVKFLSYAIAGGALLAGQLGIAILGLTVLVLVQIGCWVVGDGAFERAASNVGTATGLGPGTRAFEPPHTGTNYLLKEFVFVVGRKHSTKLRVIAVILMGILPVGLLALPFSHLFAVLAVFSHIAGVMTARWLFFAEAEHVVGLYYGKR
jgi:DMSO reductase anchor subunit